MLADRLDRIDGEPRCCAAEKESDSEDAPGAYQHGNGSASTWLTESVAVDGLRGVQGDAF